MTWKEAARKFRVQRDAMLLGYRVASTERARYSNQLAVIRTLGRKYRTHDLSAHECMDLIEAMLRENGQ